jgi:endoglucanase
MKQLVSLSFLLLFLIAASCSSSSNENGDDGNSQKSALQYFRDEGIKAGWNLGNTMEAMASWTDRSMATETGWGNPEATQELMNGVKAQGIDIVRIGCTWIGHVGNAPEYKISETRLQRIAQIIDMVHAAGMKAIINIHHDGNYTNPPNTWGFLKFAEVGRGEVSNDDVKDQLSKMWTQIANHFKNYGDELIFETMNEVHSGNWGSDYNPGYTGYSYTNEQNILFDWNQTALNAIRATGGNNATRYVAIPGLGSTEPETVIAAHNRGKLLPNDGANGTDKLIVSVHFYAPWQYTVADITGQGGEGRHTISQAELNNIATQAGHIKTNFIDKGIAVYYGEWGAQTNVRSSMSQKIKDDHKDYISRVARAANANGIVPIIWDDGGNFRILSRSNGIPQNGFWKEVWDAYMEEIN